MFKTNVCIIEREIEIERERERERERANLEKTSPKIR
jgi:hypothetical protein